MAEGGIRISNLPEYSDLENKDGDMFLVGSLINNDSSAQSYKVSTSKIISSIIDKIENSEDSAEIKKDLENLKTLLENKDDSIDSWEDVKNFLAGLKDTESLVDDYLIWNKNKDHNSAYMSSCSSPGDYSVAEGKNTQANGESSHAGGEDSYANGKYSVSMGYKNIAENNTEAAFGKYNGSKKGDSSFGDNVSTLFSVGNGNDSSTRHNALEIKQDGTILIPDMSDNSEYYRKPMLNLQSELKRIDNVEATKLKNPVKLWGNEFDGSEDVIGDLDIDGGDLMNISSLFFEGGTFINETQAKHFKDALEGVAKAADDSKVIKKIIVNHEVESYPLSDGIIDIHGFDGINIHRDDFNEDVIKFTADVDYLATREYVNEKIDNAPQLEDGQIPSQYLPSYVDDVIDFDKEVSGSDWKSQAISTDIGKIVWNAASSANSGEFYHKFVKNTNGTESGLQIIEPEAGKIYVNNNNNNTYRWSGSNLIEISKSIAIGTTASTAFAGNRGQALENKISEIEPKLEGVTKAADDSKVVKGIKELNYGNIIYPIDEGLIELDCSIGLNCDFTDHGIALEVDTDYVATKEYVDDKLDNIDASLPDYIEADKLKNPIKLWGNDFDGSKDVNGEIIVDSIGSPYISTGKTFSIEDGKEGNVILEYVRDSNSMQLGCEGFDLTIYSTTTFSDNITAPNITEIESKLEDVTKAADINKTVGNIYVGNKAKKLFDVNIDNGILPLVIDGGLKTSHFQNKYVLIEADTDILATKEYIDDKIDFLVNSEGELEDSFDTLKEVDTWIKSHEGATADIISDINEINDWKGKIDNLKTIYDINPQYDANKCYLQKGYNKLIDGSATGSSVEFNSATTELAGVMSAEDKTNLDSVVSKLEDVDKVADDSEVIKKIIYGVTQVKPQDGGIIFTQGNGILFNNPHGVGLAISADTEYLATKEYVDDKLDNIDASLPDYIEADKLKTPVKIFGQQFDGTNDLRGTISIDSGLRYEGGVGNLISTSTTPYLNINTYNKLLSVAPEIKFGIGTNTPTETLDVVGNAVISGNITSPNITAIESKLNGINAIADLYNQIGLNCYNNGDYTNMACYSSTTLQNGNRILLNANEGLKFSQGMYQGKYAIDISADTEILATKEDLESKADDSKVIKAFNFIKDKANIIKPPKNGIIIVDVRDEAINITENNVLGESTGVNLRINTDYLATREYVDDKIDFLVNEEGQLEDSFDTLKEVDTWIKEHETEAADIISDINTIKDRNYIYKVDWRCNTNVADLYYHWYTADGTQSNAIARLPNATATLCGAMTPDLYNELKSATEEINKLKAELAELKNNLIKYKEV